MVGPRLLVIGLLATSSVIGACGSTEVGPDHGGNDANILLNIEWDLEPGEETFICVRRTLEEDIWVNAMYPIVGPGNHHGLIATLPDDTHELWGPEGIEEDCVPFAGQFGTQMFAAAGGSVDHSFYFPEGVATRLAAGTQVFANYHIYNATDSVLSGASGLEMDRVDASEVEEEAELLLVARLSLNVPPREVSTHVGQCPMPDDATLFGVGAHMHQWATHQKVIAKSSIVGDVVIWDEPWDFDEGNQMVRIDEVPMAQGDIVEIHCTFDNTTDRTLVFADKASEEMCTSAIYQYPANLLGATFCGD